MSKNISKCAWKRFIFDEPGHTRVPGMVPICAGFYWFVTATPNAITVNHRNCKNSFMKSIIGDNIWGFESQFSGMIVKNNLDFVTKSFDMPQTYYHFHSCFQPMLTVVSGMVNSTINRMIDAGNIEGAIEALGGTKTKNIVELVKQKKTQELEKVLTELQKRPDNNSLLRRRNDVQQHLKELNSRFEAMLKNVCNICLDRMKDPVLEISCQNLFCGECLLKWLQRMKTCPLCRSDVNLSELIYIDQNSESMGNTNPPRLKTKNEKIVEIINNSQNGKFLIFSAYNATFDPICKLLEENNFTYAVLKGSSTNREKSIEKFKSGELKVIFLNSNFNGAGINLQEATDIILYHEMDNYIQKQIIGRANRIGRKVPLHVHRFKIEN